MADTSVRPPLRIATIKTTTISASQASANVEQFLADYASRAGGPGGGDSTIRLRLETFSDAVRAEQKQQKAHGLKMSGVK